MFQDKVDNVQELFDDGPEKVLSKELDRAAQKCINQAVMQSSAISFATGIQVVWLWQLPFPQILRNSMAIL